MSGVAQWEAEYNRTNASNAASGPSLPRRGQSALIEDEDDAMPDIRRDPMPDILNELGLAPPAKEALPAETPLEQLTRHWMNERHAPDILPSQDVLLSSLLDHIRRQVGLLPLLCTPVIHIPVGNNPTSSGRSINFRGRAHQNYARPDGGRARQVYRALVCAYPAFQGTLPPSHSLDARQSCKSMQIENYARYIIANEEVQTRITTAERDYASR
jgi:GINS complex subunit 4